MEELFTIGHSNHGIETFISLLCQHKITALADVRSCPYSRYLTHFNQAALKSALNKAKIYYVFLGEELGARPDDTECYVDGRAVYENIASTDSFQKGILRVVKGANQHQIALMCAEKEPLVCHRAILVCQHLKKYNLNINHILKDGSLESHKHLEARMLAKHGLGNSLDINSLQMSLLDQEAVSQVESAELLEEAYRLQGYEIAYTEKGEPSSEQKNRPVYHRVY